MAKTVTVPTTGVFVRPVARRFYDGSTPDRTLRECRRCRRPEDPLFPHCAATPGCRELGREVDALRAELRDRERWQAAKVEKAQQKRDAGIARASSTDPAGHERAVAIIREAAARLPEFSANAVRRAMDDAGVKPTLVAGAFRSCVADKILATTNRGEPSLAESTNSHRLVIYRSRVYGSAVA